MRILLLFILFIPTAHAIFGTGMELSVAGDVSYTQGLSDGSLADEKLSLRGAELMFYAPIDHNFEGVISAAAHDENGQVNFELHELFVGSSKWIPRSTIRIGQFFMGFGRLNRFHRHDWPFTSTPKVIDEFFGMEGVFDAGGEFSYLAPLDFYLNFTLGLTSGYQWGHSHTAGSKPKVPTHYLRASTFKSFSTTSGMELGINYVGRVDKQDNDMKLAGLDFTSKWRRGKEILWLLQSEFWYRNITKELQETSSQMGIYVFGSHSFKEWLSAGLRIDGFKDLNKINPFTGKKINNVNYQLTGQGTYHSSEFLKIRGSISHLFDREEGLTRFRDTRAELQVVFILGSHAAHDF
jgi:hypothetical protein